MTIYFIDEDHPILQSWLIELEFRGFSVRSISDADRAFALLEHATDVEWVIIDVMLAASEQRDSRYPEERTEQGLIAGLTLLRDLCKVRPDIFPRKAHLLTAATNKEPYMAARECANELGITLTRKTDVEGPRDFGDRVKRAMGERG